MSNQRVMENATARTTAAIATGTTHAGRDDARQRRAGSARVTIWVSVRAI